MSTTCSFSKKSSAPGWILGVHPHLLCAEYSQSVQLYKRIKARHCDYGKDAIDLTHALIKGIHKQPPFFLPDHALYALASVFMGEEASEALKLPKTPKINSILKAGTPVFQLFSYLLKRSKTVERISHHVGHTYGRWIIKKGLKEEPATFDSTLEP